jgi:hypothetical protein
VGERAAKQIGVGEGVTQAGLEISQSR